MHRLESGYASNHILPIRFDSDGQNRLKEPGYHASQRNLNAP
jgi:hypothetical protein